MGSKKTPWFDCKAQLPVYEGWYEVRLMVHPPEPANKPKYLPIERLYFKKGAWSRNLAFDLYKLTGKDKPGAIKGDVWRGLAKKPR